MLFYEWLETCVAKLKELCEHRDSTENDDGKQEQGFERKANWWSPVNDENAWEEV
jgi:hypothetical protein